MKKIDSLLSTTQEVPNSAVYKGCGKLLTSTNRRSRLLNILIENSPYRCMIMIVAKSICTKNLKNRSHCNLLFKKDGVFLIFPAVPNCSERICFRQPRHNSFYRSSILNISCKRESQPRIYNIFLLKYDYFFSLFSPNNTLKRKKHDHINTFILLI
jgi:hypothetical protein